MSAADTLYKPCPCCGGQGVVVAREEEKSDPDRGAS